MDRKSAYSNSKKIAYANTRSNNGLMRIKRAQIYLGMDAFKLAGSRPGDPRGGTRLPVGGVVSRRSDYNDLRVIGFKGKSWKFDAADLQVRMRNPKQVMAIGIGEARSVAARRRPLKQLQPTSRNPAAGPTIQEGARIMVERRPRLVSMNFKRLMYYPSKSSVSNNVGKAGMYRRRTSPYLNQAKWGAANAGLEEYQKHHYVVLHTPTWVKLLKGDFRNDIKVPHPSQRANEKLGSYAGNIRLNKFRNPFRDNAIGGAGKMVLRIRPEHSFEASGYPMRIKQDRYVRAPLASRDALMVREPDRAYIRSALMQANLKMIKSTKPDLATDATFFRRQAAMENGRNGEKKSWKKVFAGLLGRSPLIPASLKAKWLNPGFDRREKGLWAK